MQMAKGYWFTKAKDFDYWSSFCILEVDGDVAYTIIVGFLVINFVDYGYLCSDLFVIEKNKKKKIENKFKDKRKQF